MSQFNFVGTLDLGTLAKSTMLSGFPSVFIASGGPYHPTIVPLHDTLLWYWQYDKWSLSSDFSVTSGATTDTINNGTMNGGHRDVIGSPLTDELELIVSSPTGPYVANTADSALASSVLSLTLFLDGVNDAPVIYLNGTTYRPALAVHGQLSVTDSGNTITVEVASDPSFLAGGVAGGSIAATIDGFAFTLYYKVQVSDPGTSFVLTTFSLTPATSLPYNP